MCGFSYVLRDGVWHESKLYSCLQNRGQKLSLYNFSIFYSSLTKLIFMLIWKFNHFVSSFLKQRFHNEFNCGSVRFGGWCNRLSFRCESTGKDILEIRHFKSATIRSCFFYSNFHYRFYYCSVFYEVGVFQLDCEESTFCFSLLSCTVGYALPNPKLWIKLFQQLIDFLWQCLGHLVVAKPNWLNITLNTTT